MNDSVEIMLVAEDELSEAVLRRMVAEEQGRLTIVEPAICTGGCGQIRANIEKYRNASHVYPHVILTDLDANACPAELIASWGLQKIPDNMLLRVAVRETEAWLLADGPGLSTFLQVPTQKLPRVPETVSDPKQELVNIARKSRSGRLAADLVPEQGARVPQGPLYNARLCRFVAESWNIRRAAQEAPSLARALKRLSVFMRP